MWWGLSISRWKKGLIQQHSPWGFQQVSFLSYPRFFLLDSWKKQPLQWWQRVHVAWNPLTIADLTAVPTEGANCQCCCSLVTKLCLNLCNLTDCSLAGSSVHGILQARTLEWVAISFSKNWTQGLNPDPLHCRWISCELSFEDKMRAIAWKTAFQMALRNCSKEVWGRSVYTRFWWMGSACNQAHIFFFFAGYR